MTDNRTTLRNLPIWIGILDCFLIIALFFLFLFINDPLWDRSLKGLLIFAKTQYKSLLFLLVFWFVIANQVKLYKNFRFMRFLEILKRIFFQIVLFAIVIFAISGGKKENLYSSTETFYLLGILSIYLGISRFTIHRLLKSLWKKGVNTKNVVLLGFNDNAQGLVELLNKKKEFGLNITDVFVVKNPINSQKPLDINSIEEYIEQNNIDIAYISLGNGMDEMLTNQTVQLLEKNYISIGYIPDSSLEIKQNLEINYLDSFPILNYKKLPLDDTFNQITKRLFDLAFTLCVFIFLLSWLMPIIALLVLITQGRPIFFSQKRNGLNGKEFDCLKFRTMIPHKHNSVKPTERNDPRVTRLGRILRKTSLDELPQFINVLKGEMSIVGPRPHMVSENESYSDIIKRYSLRHYVKPGITGLAQTKGYRGAIDSNIDMEKRIRADIYYVRNWSFLLDIFIIYKTVKLMIFGDENAI